MIVLRTVGQLRRVPLRNRRVRKYDLALVFTGMGWPFVPGDYAEITVCDPGTHRPLHTFYLRASQVSIGRDPFFDCFTIPYLTAKNSGLLDDDPETYYEFEVRKLRTKGEPDQGRDPPVLGL